MSSEFDFPTAFQQLTGKEPLSWQSRLFEHFASGVLCDAIDLPTGLGKTMVMAIWLIARRVNTKLPRRLIYVVDRRTVVDQATDLAQRLVQRPITKWMHDAFNGEPPAISTLRGRLADNREWSRDPTRPAIIIGTVDLIGSALLFSGYRSSFKRRPLEAGLLGQDSLLVLDEAHLSKAFEKLLMSIADLQKSNGVPMHVIRMSATSGAATNGKIFRLDTDPNSKTFDLWSKIENGTEINPIRQRYEASKKLIVKESTNVVDFIADAAGKIAADKPGSRIVIFVKSPKDVDAVRKALLKKDKSRESKIAQLTGTMRGFERDRLVDIEMPIQESDHERRIMQRFLRPDNDASHGECFLISTSAGEVGFDFNADHLVGDAAPLDSWIQRLGRVNRRGDGDAIVILVKKTGPPNESKFDEACRVTSNLLTDGMDVSPKALDSLRLDYWKRVPVSELKLLPRAVGEINFRKHCQERGIAVLQTSAHTPEPKMVELTDILLDAWSMTSITEPVPGRPEVSPWLRGIAEWEPPQTTIAWRAELDLDGFADLDIDDVVEWFDTHRVLTHETLSVKTNDAATWFKQRWAILPEARQREFDKLPSVIDRAGTEVVPLGEVISRLSRKTGDADAFLRGAEVVVPASFGGIRRGVGLLDHTEPKLDKAEEKNPPAEQEAILNARRESIDVADVRGRYREKVEKPENGKAVSTALDPKAVKPAKYARYPLELEADDDKVVRLFSYVLRSEKQEYGSQKQTLVQHVHAVRKAVDHILSRLSFPKDIEPIVKLAAQLAADWHDHGKNREFFQRTVGGTPTHSVEQWQAQKKLDDDDTHQCLGKSGGRHRGKPARGYRHEFGSLREFVDAFNARKLLDDAGKPISQDVFDLAMHMIATHHGRGRPHFPKGGFDPGCEMRSDEIHTETVQRFARLQRRYGWWHLASLENLLRCADALASADQEAEDDPADSQWGVA